MTHIDPAAPVETKVKAGTAGSLVGAVVGLLLSLLATRVYDGEPPPDAVAQLLTALVTAGLAAVGSFWAGYRAKHTPRLPVPPDPEVHL